MADCALFENALAGPHVLDVTSLRPKVRVPAQLKGIDGWRIAISVDLGAWAVDPEVAANTRAVGEALEDAGAIVDEVAIPWNLQHIMATARRHYAAIFGAEIGGAAAAFGDLLNDYALAWAEEAQMYMPSLVPT